MVNCIVLLILSLILFVAGGWTLPITDPTECCYTLTAKEMLEAGDWLSPRIYGNFWFDKPIMFYWELMISYKLFGFGDFASRIFPALFATGGVFLTYFFGAKIYNAKIGFAAAVMLATSLEYWYISHAIITDMTLLFTFSLTLMAFFIGYRSDNPKMYLIAFAASGVAVLTKGPIGFLLPGLIILLFLLWQGDLKHLRKLFTVRNFLTFAIIVAVWYLPMMILHGSEFVENFFGVHNFLRATVTEYEKTNVWYYYTLISIVGFLPWSIPLLPAAVVKFFRRAELFIEEGRLPVFDVHEKFLIVWALTVVIFFQLCATKYVTYTLPAMPAAMIFIARYFANRWKLFLAMTAGVLIIFPLTLRLVALPLAEDNSGRRAAEVISPLIDEQTCVVSFDNGYSGSLVFYTGAKIFRLEDADNYERLRPRELTWSIKNVMPFMSFDELPSDKKIIAVVGIEREQFFLACVKGDWQLVGAVPKGELEAWQEKTFHNKQSPQKFKYKIYRRSTEVK